MTKIWQRYFIAQVLKTLFLFLICFFALFVMIDYSTHASSFQKNLSHQPLLIFYYYIAEFVNRLNVLLPFALLLATIKTLCSLNIHNELIAMMASGTSLKKLMQPFLLIGVFCTLLLFANEQFFLPLASKQLNTIDTIKRLQKKKNQNLSYVQSLALKDNSTLIFEDYNTDNKLFNEVFWVKNFDDIYSIRALYPMESPPKGFGVRHLKRDSSGKIKVTEEFSSKEFPDMRYSKKALIETLSLADELSLSELYKNLPKANSDLNQKQSEWLTSFHKKMAQPLIALLVVISAAPFCVRTTRNLKVFFIYAGCLFGLVALNLILDSSEVLGERGVLSPPIAIWTPFILIYLIAIWHYVRMR